ncbi:MAG: hypothetical protein ACP5K7_07350, partial [Verrucomicrobiia bacterium]
DKGKIMVTREFGSALKKIQNATIIDSYKTKLAARLGVAKAAVDEEFKKITIQPQSKTNDEELAKDATPISKDELWLLKIVFSKPTTIEILNDYLDVNWIQDTRIQTIIEKLMQQKPETFDVSRFIEEFENVEQMAIISESAIKPDAIPNPEKQISDLIKKLRNKFIKQQIDRLKMQLSQNNLDDNTILNLLKNISELKKAQEEPLFKKGEI